MGYDNEDEAVNIGSGTVKKVTNKAVLFAIDNGEETWFPLSQVAPSTARDIEEGEELTEFLVTEWIAEQKGLEGV